LELMTMKRIKTHLLARAAVALLAIAALGIAAVPANGDGGEKSKIVIKKLKPTGASGKVSSKDHSCVSGKKVSLFRFDDYVSVKIEITHSKSDGSWRTKKDLKEGKYFAKVDASAGCRYAVSKYETLR
jgi:hypothetical protein